MFQDTDNGDNAKEMIGNAFVSRILNQLSKKDKEIMEMLMDGYSQQEVIKKKKTNYPYIKRLKERIKKLIND